GYTQHCPVAAEHHQHVHLSGKARCIRAFHRLNFRQFGRCHVTINFPASLSNEFRRLPHRTGKCTLGRISDYSNPLDLFSYIFQSTPKILCFPPDLPTATQSRHATSIPALRQIPATRATPVRESLHHGSLRPLCRPLSFQPRIAV